MKFPIVLCDPPWEYADRRPGQGGASAYYSLSGLDVMATWADQFLAMRPESGVMLMWVTGPYAEDAYKLMRAWGYEPVKPIFYWGKLNPNGGAFYGSGAYTGSNVEFILLGHADPNAILARANRRNQGGDGEGIHELQLIPHPRDEQGKIIHSRKPAVFRDLIVKLFGDLPRVEVFARERIPGWHAIGDQLPGGQAIAPGKVIAPLPPPSPYEAGLRRRGEFVQPSLFFPEGA